MTTTHETLHYKNKSVFNTIGFILMIGVNTMAVLLPINGQQPRVISDKYANLFTPANFTFTIWNIVYLSLLAFIVYQLWLAFSSRPSSELQHMMARMKDWWLISCVANAGWLFSWHYEILPVSLILMILLLASLIIIHLRFHIATPTAPLPEKIFIYIPFSLYLGWISIATLANIAALLVYAGWGKQPAAQVPITIVLISIGTMLAIAMVLLRNNITHALVAIWAFYGIILKRRQADVMTETPVIHAAVISVGIIAIAISWQLYRKQKT